MKLVRNAKIAYIAISAAMILLGVLLVAYPAISSLAVCYTLGGLIALFGIIKLIGYFSKDIYRLAFQFDLALGILALVVGAVMIICPEFVLGLFPIILGVLVIIDGVLKVQTSIDARRFGMKAWWMILLLAAVSCLGGLFMILNPFEGAAAMMILLGITLFVYGIQNICVVIYTVKAVKAADRMMNDR